MKGEHTVLTRPGTEQHTTHRIGKPGTLLSFTTVSINNKLNCKYRVENLLMCLRKITANPSWTVMSKEGKGQKKNVENAITTAFLGFLICPCIKIVCTQINTSTIQYEAMHFPLLQIFLHKTLIKVNEGIQ